MTESNENNISEMVALQERIDFVEKQYHSLQLNMKYQRESYLNIIQSTSNADISMLLDLVPYKYRSLETLRALQSSKHNWIQFMLRHPFKIRAWLLVKRLQRRQQKSK